MSIGSQILLSPLILDPVTDTDIDLKYNYMHQLLITLHKVVYALSYIIGASRSEPHTNHSYEKIAVPMYVCMYVCLFVCMYRLYTEVQVSTLFTQPRAEGPRLCKSRRDRTEVYNGLVPWAMWS